MRLTRARVIVIESHCVFRIHKRSFHMSAHVTQFNVFAIRLYIDCSPSEETTLDVWSYIIFGGDGLKGEGS